MRTMSDLPNMKDFWNKTAEKYGEKEDYRPVLIPSSKGLLNWYVDCLQHRALARMINGLSGKQVLDVGCGVGRWSARMAGSGAAVVGLDLSSGMISKAKKRLARQGLSADFVVASVHKLPFKSKIFDAVVSVTVLQHIVEESLFKSATQDLARVLQEEGEVILLEYSYASGKKQSFSPEFPTVAHCYQEAFEEDSQLGLVKTQGVDLSLFLKPFNRINKKSGRYKANLNQESAASLYQLLSGGFYLLASAACVLSLPIDLALSDTLKKYSEHQIFVFKSKFFTG